MTVQEIATALYDEAMAQEQSARLIQPGDDLGAIRAEVRRIAKADGNMVRTGILDDTTLAVIRSDAKLWSEPTSVMREKLRRSLQTDATANESSPTVTGR